MSDDHVRQAFPIDKKTTWPLDSGEKRRYLALIGWLDLDRLWRRLRHE